MSLLSEELSSENQAPHIRSAAGLALKNALTSKDSATQANLTGRWLTVLPPALQATIKDQSLQTLASRMSRAGTVSAQVVAAIAAIELPLEVEEGAANGRGWPELIPSLLKFVGDAENQNLRMASLQAIGFVCEVIVRFRPHSCFEFTCLRLTVS